MSSTPIPIIPDSSHGVGFQGGNAEFGPQAGLGGQPQEQPAAAPSITGPAGEPVNAPHESVARHIMEALGGSNGEPLAWAKGIISGGLAAAANVGTVPPGGGALTGITRTMAGLRQQGREDVADKQKQAQIQQEMQLKQAADTRAQKELENSTDRTKSEIALWNVKQLQAIHEEQQNQLLRPYLLGEDKDKFEALETAKQLARIDLKKQLLEAGVKPEELEKSYGYDDAPSGAAQNIGNSNMMIAHNGEIPSADEDKVGAHGISDPAKIFNEKIPTDRQVISGYTYNPKTHQFDPQYTTAVAGTSRGDLLAMHAAAMDYLQQQENQVAKQGAQALQESEIKKNKQEAFKAGEEGELAKSQILTGPGGAGAGTMAIDQKTGANEQYLSTLNPSIAAEVRAIGEGRVEINSRMFQSKQGQQLAAALTTAYPGFDQSKAQSYFKTRQDFTSGKTAVSINSYNTAIAHLGTMFDHLSAVNSAELNNPWGEVHRQLDLDKQLVSTELAKAVSNGQLTEGEKNDILKSVSGYTVGSYRDRIKEAVTLLHGKQEAFQQQWNNAAPPGAVSQVPIISPQAESTIAKISGHQQPQAQQPGHPHPVGEVKEYMGAKYMFDGKQYVLQQGGEEK